MKKSFTLLSISCLFLSFFGCRDKADEMQAVSIEANPSEISLNAGEQKTVTIVPKPGGSASWSVADSPSWLTVEPSSGVMSSEGAELTLTDNGSMTDVGTTSGVLEILSSAGPAEVNITLTVDPEPEVSLDKTEIDFGETEAGIELQITNTGTGSLNFQIADDAEWLSFSSENTSLSAGASETISLTVDRTNLAIGNFDAMLTISSNAAHGNVEVPVSMTVPEMAIITNSVDSLAFDYFIDTQEFTITNDGNVAYDFSISAENELVSSNPSVGTLEIGETKTIVASAVRNTLETGFYEDILIISNNKGESETIKVGLNHFLEEKWLIDGTIEDAEFDKNNNVIVAVNGNQLRKLDPVLETESAVSLNLEASCVSVSPDGTKAVVGHSGYISYVNLTDMTLLNTFPVTINVFDIVLAANNFAYAFPEGGQHETIRSVNLSDGTETQNSGGFIYQRTRAKLHPSGDFIYGADNGISPSDFEKYDITSGNADYLYDSPYHGDHSFSGNIWISENGDFLFAKSGNIFRSSTDETTDMTYAGSFDNGDFVVSLDHSATANKVAAVFTTGSKTDNIPASEIQIFDGTYFQYQQTIALPKYIIPNGNGGGELLDSRGYFSFLNNSGSKCFVVAKDAGGNSTSSIISININ